MADLTFGSLFAGVGGFDLGMETAGWECAWQVEWDKHCQQVLARHWPKVPRWGDINDVNGGELPPVDCITFGSPCQDLSVAGKRAGLGGERSGLFHEAIRIIKEMRHATDNRFPRWAVWENVAGALSSNKGDDFGTVIDTLADAGALVIEWAVLDARWFGVPQRRRRVFVVACFDPATADGCPDPLLPVAPRSSWHPPTGRTAGPSVAALTANGVGTCGADDNQAQAGHLIPETAGTLGTTGGGGPRTDLDRMTFIPETCNAVTAKWAKGSGGPSGDECQNMIPVPFVKVIRPASDEHPEVRREEHTAPTLNAFDNGSESRATVLAFDSTWSNQSTVSTDQSPTIKVGSGLGIASPPAAFTGAAVRRLTPLECERLQGFSDDWTLRRADGAEQSDSARYKQMGNAVCAPVAAWIGRHIAAATP